MSKCSCTCHVWGEYKPKNNITFYGNKINITVEAKNEIMAEGLIYDLLVKTCTDPTMGIVKKQEVELIREIVKECE